MSEEIIKQEETKQEGQQGTGKDEYINFPIFLYFAGAMWMIIIAIILMFAFGKILAPAVVFFGSIVIGVLSGVPIIGMGKIVELLFEINKKNKIKYGCHFRHPYFLLV